MTDKLKELALECKEREIDFDDVSPNQGSTSCNKLVRHYIAAASPDAILALIAENERLRTTIFTDNSQTVAYATKRIAELEAEVERVTVQLAGCGVAAMGNTASSKSERAKRGDYGYSESYSAVCQAVDREIELRERISLAVTMLKTGMPEYDAHDVLDALASGAAQKEQK